MSRDTRNLAIRSLDSPPGASSASCPFREQISIGVPYGNPAVLADDYRWETRKTCGGPEPGKRKESNQGARGDSYYAMVPKFSAASDWPLDRRRQSTETAGPPRIVAATQPPASMPI